MLRSAAGRGVALRDGGRGRCPRSCPPSSGRGRRAKVALSPRPAAPLRSVLWVSLVVVFLGI